MGMPWDRLKLDVYVLTPDELDRLVAEARANGMRDAQLWDMPNAEAHERAVARTVQPLVGNLEGGQDGR